MDIQERFADNRTDNEMFIRCSCGGDHFITFDMFDEGFDIDDDYPSDFYINVHSEALGWNIFNRLWRGIKYILGIDDDIWTNLNLNPKDADKIIDFLNKYKATCKAWEEKHGRRS